jgi:hypothetical protein
LAGTLLPVDGHAGAGVEHERQPFGLTVIGRDTNGCQRGGGSQAAAPISVCCLLVRASTTGNMLADRKRWDFGSHSRRALSASIIKYIRRIDFMKLYYCLKCRKWKSAEQFIVRIKEVEQRRQFCAECRKRIAERSDAKSSTTRLAKALMAEGSDAN